MRSLFLLLLFINALAWVYQRWIILPDDPRPALYVEQDYPRLNALPRAAAVAEAAAESTAPAATRCIRIGPVEQVANAEGIATRLRNRGIEVSAAEEQSRLWVGHWVQIVGLADREAAEASRNRLIAAGLADAYIVTGGEELKISLGVFKSDDSAERIIGRARDLGFRTRMEERYQEGTAWWLDVKLPGGAELRQGELLSASGSILRTEEVPCAATEPGEA